MDFTTEDLYEQTKRVIRQSIILLDFPQEGTWNDNFILACHECGLPMRNDIEIGMYGDHAHTHGIDPNEGEMTVDLIWIGEGPPPNSHDKHSI